MKYIVVLIILVLVIVVGYYAIGQFLNFVGNIFSPSPEEQIEEEVTLEEKKEVIPTPIPTPIPIIRNEPKETTKIISPPKPTVTPPAGFTVSELSIYYDKVNISSINRSYDLRLPRIAMLRARSRVDGGINVTGWYLKSNEGDTIFIPQAVREYSPFRRTVGDIILDLGDMVEVHFSKSPVGVSLRLNACIGYLNNIYAFMPVLPRFCPSLDLKKTVSFTGECQNIVRSLSRCEEPTAQELSSFVVTNDSQCRDFLGAVNFRGCYDTHFRDTNFFDNRWWVWLDDEFALDKFHDRILLFDKEGLLVDEYVY